MTTVNTSSFLSANDFRIAPVAGSIQVKSFPSSEAQREIWLHSQLCVEANCAFNETVTLELVGELNHQLLEQAIRSTVQRHEMLRATFSSDGQTVFVAEQSSIEAGLTDGSSIKLDIVDYSNLSDSDAAAKHAESVERDGRRPFDLQNGPLLRVRLTRLNPQRHLLTVSAHHIVMDGWSAFVFSRDVGQTYDQLRGCPTDPLPPADLYSKYSSAMIQHESSVQGQQDAEYWRKQFADSIPTLDLPTDRARGDVRTFSSRRYDHTIQPAQLALIRKSAAKLGCSLFNFVFLGFHAFLARLTGQNDFSIGVPTAGQASMDFQNLIGHCVNTVPIRTKVDLQAIVQDYAKQSRLNMLDSLEHQRYTFGSLVRDLNPPRDPARPPVFSAMINIDPELDGKQLGFAGLEVKLHVEPRVYENFEWFISGVIRRDGQLQLQCQYNSDLFDHASIEHYIQCFETFLLAMAQNPQAKLADLQMLSIAQRQKISVDWNSTDRDYPTDTTVFQEIHFQALRTPNRIAAVFDGQQASYAQLLTRVNQLAHYLQQRGVKSGDRVGVCMPRSLEMLISTLAIWRCGAAYVPLDPTYPVDRLRMMVDDSQLKQVIANGRIPDGVVPPTVSVIDLISVAQQLQSMPTANVEANYSSQDIAYVIYTSGSTGKPKGVQVPQGSVVNFLYSMREQPGIEADDRVLAITTLSFDISVLELFLPLTVGAQVVIADQASVVDGKRMSQLLDRHEITVLQATPSTWRMLLSEGWTGRGKIKALCGGEAFPRDLAKRMLDNCRQVWNMYGPTETTVWSTACQITDPDAPIFIGRPIANTQLYVLDANMQQVPIGAVGELYIGGAGVTCGYLNRPDLTGSKFVDNPFFNPFKDYVNHRLYQTGDLVRYRADGNIQYLQRNDKQIKLRGHRIELGEIEFRISQLDDIKQVVVVVREDQPNDPRLVAYFVPQAGRQAAPERIRESLQLELPGYMIPQYFVELENLPQTANGKIDRKQLPAPSSARVTPALTSPSSESQLLIAQLWRELLEVDELGLQDNFFNLGGHSLLVIQVIAKVEQACGVRLSPQDFLVGTLEQLAAKLDTLLQANRPAEPATCDVAIPASAVQDAGKDPIQYLGPKNEQILTNYHAPQSKRQHTLGILIAAPIGTEYQRTHWAVRRLTQQLTRAGYAVMRFDYRGLGDSAGETADIESLKTWQADLQAAAALLREKSGCEEIVIVGLRMGAAIALKAALDNGIAGLKHIVAWQPVLDGAAYLNSLRQMQVQMLDLWSTEVSTLSNPTHEEILGAIYSRKLLAEIDSIQYSDATQRRLPDGVQLHIVDQSDTILQAASDSQGDARSDASSTSAENANWEDLRFLEIAWLPNQQPRQIVKLLQSCSSEAQ